MIGIEPEMNREQQEISRGVFSDTTGLKGFSSYHQNVLSSLLAC